MPRSLNDILEHADELAKVFEDHESTGEAATGPSLAALRELVVARASLERSIITAVTHARTERHSWAAIGAMLGTTGEAARLRYKNASSLADSG